MNRLGDAVSPYLRSHADNPVDWFPWGEDAFEEAARRNVPVLVSIGYATCHWCHVMARESFADPDLARTINERFVAVKVDREEHPDVDATYLAAASAFTPNLGWPLNVFTTPDGRAFYAGTYWPPHPLPGNPAFREVLDAVAEAWRERRTEVEDVAAALAEALVTPVVPADGESTAADFAAAAEQLLAAEDREYGGFQGAPKFPVAPTLLAALRIGALRGLPEEARSAADGFARRTLAAMAASGLRDPVEGGFFRYATRRDWTEPHYERMLYDNAQLLRAYAAIGDERTAAGIASFLERVLRRPSGAFGSGQDSESIVGGQRSEGGYYSLDAGERAAQPRPAVDGKVLTGWNGLAIGALASAGWALARPAWIELARGAADAVLASARRRDGTLLRATLDGRVSTAAATLEDYGMLARGLLELSLATGEVRYAETARELVDACLAGRERPVFAPPGGADRTLARRGLALPAETGDGAYPSGLSESAVAALLLHELTADPRYREAADRTLAPLAGAATARPVSLGATLEALARLEGAGTALLIVGPRSQQLEREARAARMDIAAAVTADQAAAFAAGGFSLFEARGSLDGRATAYLCERFVCRLPIQQPAELAAALGARRALGASAQVGASMGWLGSPKLDR